MAPERKIVTECLRAAGFKNEKTIEPEAIDILT
jgi:hypothetical protein